MQQQETSPPGSRTLQDVAEDRQQHLAFLEHWRTEVDPIYEDKRLALRASVDVAQSVIRALFLLSGGALVTLPVFARLVGVRGHDSATVLLLPAGCFILGLVLCTAAGLIGQIALRSDAATALHLAEWAKISVNLNFKREKDPVTAQGRQAAENELMMRCRAVSRRWTFCGMVLTVVSLCAFLAGAVVAGVNLVQGVAP